MSFAGMESDYTAYPKRASFYKFFSLFFSLYFLPVEIELQERKLTSGMPFDAVYTEVVDSIQLHLVFLYAIAVNLFEFQLITYY